MGQLVDGEWVKGSVITSDESGAFDRQPSTFRDTVAAEHGSYLPESGRYHLYVAYACPWAHRALIFRELKGLRDHISVSVVHPDMLEMGWSFDTDFPGANGDELLGKDYLHQVYQVAQPDVSGKATVPVLWDKQTGTIVNNESAELIRIFNSAFNGLTGNTDDYYPESLRADIDAWNERIYHHVNNGVYRAGFAQTQAAYDEAVSGLFGVLDELERHLGSRDFLVGGQLTEADIRLIPTLLRFDLVYFTHFKCNVRRIGDYPNLSAYRRRLYDMDAVKATTHFDHIKRHYYYSHESINPQRIVPAGPAVYV
jgi:putative glutathione S-transferase